MKTRSKSTNTNMALAHTQQAIMTDFFSNVVATRRNNNNNNNQIKEKLLLQEPLFTRTATTTATSVGTNDYNVLIKEDKKEEITTPNKKFKRSDDKKNRESMITVNTGNTIATITQRCTRSTTKKKSSNTTTKKSTTITRSSKKMIDFGVRINRLDFENTTNITTPPLPLKDSPVLLSLGKEKNQQLKVTETNSADSVLKNVNEIKAKLKDCKNLNKLKEHLSAIKEASGKLKKKSSSEIKTSLPKVLSPSKDGKVDNLKRPRCRRNLFDSNEVQNDSEAKNIDSNNNNLSKTIIDLPSSSSSSDVHAPIYYKRSYLSKKNNVNDDNIVFHLPLPLHFTQLLQMFKLLDEISSIHLKRQQVCTFERVKQAIEQSIHRTFTLVTLAKVLTVLGRERRFFKLEYDFIDRRSQLTIVPLYPDCIHQMCINSATLLLERQREFYEQLLELTKQAHLKFLSQRNIVLSPSQNNSASEVTLFRWHPAFQLDTVPDIKTDITFLPNPQSHDKNSNHRNSPNTILKYLIQRKPCVFDENNPSSSSCDNVDGHDNLKRMEFGKLKGIKMDLIQKVLFCSIVFFYFNFLLFLQFLTVCA